MTGPDTPATRRPLRTASVRRAVRAPELERYLARASVDLAVTDQVEALQVRLERGLAVLHERATEGLSAARREMVSQGIRSGAFGVAGAVLGVRFTPDQPVLWAVIGLLVARVVVGLVMIARARADRRALQELAAAAQGGLEGAKSADEVLAFGQWTLEAARGLGMCAEEEG